MYKCLYDALKDECNAIASAIYTTYRLAQKNRWLITKNCIISE